MALLNKAKMQRIEPKNIKQQIEIAKAEYFSVDYCGKKYFQIGTFGKSGKSENQTIRFDRETAIFLIEIISEEFDLQPKLIFV